MPNYFFGENAGVGLLLKVRTSRRTNFHGTKVRRVWGLNKDIFHGFSEIILAILFIKSLTVNIFYKKLMLYFQK